jgi:hypothetical protein
MLCVLLSRDLYLRVRTTCRTNLFMFALQRFISASAHNPFRFHSSGWVIIFFALQRFISASAHNPFRLHSSGWVFIFCCMIISASPNFYLDSIESISHLGYRSTLFQHSVARCCFHNRNFARIPKASTCFFELCRIYFKLQYVYINIVSFCKFYIFWAHTRPSVDRSHRRVLLHVAGAHASATFYMFRAHTRPYVGILWRWQFWLGMHTRPLVGRSHRRALLHVTGTL